MHWYLPVVIHMCLKNKRLGSVREEGGGGASGGGVCARAARAAGSEGRAGAILRGACRECGRRARAALCIVQAKRSPRASHLSPISLHVYCHLRVSHRGSPAARTRSPGTAGTCCPRGRPRSRSACRTAWTARSRCRTGSCGVGSCVGLQCVGFGSRWVVGWRAADDGQAPAKKRMRHGRRASFHFPA